MEQHRRGEWEDGWREGEKGRREEGRTVWGRSTTKGKEGERVKGPKTLFTGGGRGGGDKHGGLEAAADSGRSGNTPRTPQEGGHVLGTLFVLFKGKVGDAVNGIIKDESTRLRCTFMLKTTTTFECLFFSSFYKHKRNVPEAISASRL